MATPNMVTSFSNVDIFDNLCEMLNLLSAHDCRVESINRGYPESPGYGRFSVLLLWTDFTGGPVLFYNMKTDMDAGKTEKNVRMQ